MTTAFTDTPQVEEFMTHDEIDEFNRVCEMSEEEYDAYLNDIEDQKFLDDYYSQDDDDAALEYYSLCCAYGEEF